ncbi:hypothetical protein SXCC_03972 [Gluconacetobacter sp. SXCC-1]|nr:hypothetical protein SXCC_03972 [Gluconacetobacter sp. SXCC-1]
MNGFGRDAVLAQEGGDLVGFMLHQREHHGALDLGRVHQKLQRLALVGGIDKHHCLTNAVHRAGRRRDLHGCRVTQQAVRQVRNALGHGGREQQRLPVGGQGRDNLADVAHETHVEHTVGFVQHQHFKAGQVNMPLAHQVQQAAGGRDQHVHATAQGLDLAPLPHAAKHDGMAEAHVAGIGCEAFPDLGCQFTGGGEHQGARTLGVGPALFTEKTVKDGQREGRGLARAGLCQTQQVTPFQQVGNGASLNGGGLGVAFLVQCAQQRLCKMKIGKRCHEGRLLARKNRAAGPAACRMPEERTDRHTRYRPLYAQGHAFCRRKDMMLGIEAGPVCFQSCPPRQGHVQSNQHKGTGAVRSRA